MISKAWVATCLVAAMAFSVQPSTAGTPPVVKKPTASTKAAPPAAKTPATTAKPVAKAGGKPTVLEFGAAWCVPCKVFAPVVTKVKDHLGAKATFQTIDTESPDGEKLSNKYGVSGLPTIIILDSAGKVLFRKSGIMDEKSLTAEVTKAVGN